MHRDSVHAVTDFRSRVGNLLRTQAVIDRPPRRAAIVGAKGARGRDRDEHAPGVGRIEHDGVQAETTGTRRPLWPRAVAAQSGQLVPVLTAVGRAEQRGILDAGIGRIRILSLIHISEPTRLLSISYA